MRENVRRVSDSSSKILYTSVFFPYYILLYYYSRPESSCPIQIIYFTRVCESYNIIIMYMYRTRLQKRVWCVFIVNLGELCSVHFRHFHRDNSSREDAYYQYIIIVIVYATKKNLTRCKCNVRYNNNNNNDNNTVVVDTGLARSKSLQQA